MMIDKLYYVESVLTRTYQGDLYEYHSSYK